MSLFTEVGLIPGDIVLDGDPAFPPKRGTSALQLSAHVYCGQTAGWIRIPLAMELGLGPSDIVYLYHVNTQNYSALLLVH